jgi:hypothetical protein
MTGEELITEQDHVERIVERLRRDEKALGEQDEELHGLVAGVIEALNARDFTRLGGFVKSLDAWLVEDYRARGVICDTIQLLYYFIGAFGTGGPDEPADGIGTLPQC